MSELAGGQFRSQLEQQAWDMAQLANAAHTVLRAAIAQRDMTVAVEGLDLPGVSIGPEAYEALDENVQRAAQDFELAGDMAMPVMKEDTDPNPTIGVPERSTNPLLTPGTDTSPSAGGQEGRRESAQPDRPARRLSKKEINQIARERRRLIIEEVIGRADENGTWEDPDISRIIKKAANIPQRQWSDDIMKLRESGCLTTELSHTKGKISKITVHPEAIDELISRGRMLPFADNQTAAQIMEARRRELAGAQAASGSRPQPELEPAVTATPPQTPRAQSGATAQPQARVREATPAASAAKPAPTSTPASPAPPPAPPPMSSRVRKLEGERTQGSADKPDRAELTDEEREVMDLKALADRVGNDVSMYQSLSTEARVAVGYLDDLLAEGFASLGELGKQHAGLLGLEQPALTEANKYLRRRELLEFQQGEDGLFRPHFTRQGRQFLRNVLSAALDNA